MSRHRSRNCHVHPGGRQTILGERERSSTPRPTAGTARRRRRRRQHRRRRHGAQQLRVGVPLLPGGAPADRGVARRAAPPHHARARGLATAPAANRCRRSPPTRAGRRPRCSPARSVARSACRRRSAADIEFRLPAPNGLHFHPPQSLWLDSDGDTKEPDISQLMVAHDVADTAYLINEATQLSKEQWTAGDFTRAGGSRMGRPGTQRRRGARRDRVDEGGLAGDDRRPRLPEPRGHPTGVDHAAAAGRPPR